MLQSIMKLKKKYILDDCFFLFLSFNVIFERKWRVFLIALIYKLQRGSERAGARNSFDFVVIRRRSFRALLGFVNGKAFLSSEIFHENFLLLLHRAKKIEGRKNMEALEASYRNFLQGKEWSLFLIITPTTDRQLSSPTMSNNILFLRMK